MKNAIRIMFLCIGIALLLFVIFRDIDQLGQHPKPEIEQKRVPGESWVMRKLFSIRTSEELCIALPEQKNYCVIDDFITRDSLEYATGSYSHGFERGNVFFDYMNIHTISLRDTVNIFHFIAPFMVSNQGSGIFYYLGLFKLNGNDNTIQHIDSIFLGDRIDIKNIDIHQHVIDIDYYAHSVGQALAAAPDSLQTKHIISHAHGFGIE